MTGADLIWSWIREQDGAVFTIDDAFSKSALSRRSVCSFIGKLRRVGILQRAGTVPGRWDSMPRQKYRLAVDYGPETPLIGKDGRLHSRRYNYDTPRAVWATFRIHECLTWADLIANVNSGQRTRYSAQSVRTYVNEVLIAGGYVINRDPSRKPAQYVLIENTGPRAPVRKKCAIWDANLGKRIDPAKGGVADV